MASGDGSREAGSDSCIRLVFHQTRHAMARLDAAGRIRWANEGLARIAGVPLDDLPGRDLPGVLSVDGGGDGPFEALRDAMARGEGFSGIVTGRRCDGSECVLDLDVRPLASGQGGFVLTAADVTEIRSAQSASHEEAQFETLMSAMLETEVIDRRRAEEALRASEERLRNAMDHIDGLASRIQRTLLVGRPVETFDGAQVALLSVPSQAVDGDFSEFDASSRCLEILIGDVMGKGFPAALLGAATKNQFLRAKAMLSSGCQQPRPAEVVQRLHQGLTPEFIRLEAFATVILAVVDTGNRLLRYVNAGHTRPVHRRAATGEVRLLSSDNVPLGVLPDEVYREESVPFEPGDVFVFYSDGVTEARAPDGTLFGETRLMDIVRCGGGLYPQHLLQRLEETLQAFAGQDAVSDDLTCVVVRIDDDPGPVERTATLDLPGRIEDLPRLRAFLAGFVASCGSPAPLDDEAMDAVLLAATETASNVIRHAYEGRSDGHVHVRVDLHADRLRLALVHDGIPLAPDAALPPSLDGTRDSGFGLFIVRQSMDEVRYVRDGSGRSIVRLSRGRTDRMRQPETGAAGPHRT